MGDNANGASGEDEPKIEGRNTDDELINEEYFNNGLSSTEAALRLEKYGRNEIPEKKTSKWKMFIRQFVGIMPGMILVAGILALIVEDYLSFGIIIAMLVLNAVIGFREESKAQNSVDALKDQMISTCGVRRDGQMVQLDTAMLVPGDIVFLRGGQVIPTDGKWIGGDRVAIDTSALTGEPFPRKIPNNKGEKQVLSGCLVKEGECYILVEKTGTNTEIGDAAMLIQEAAGTTVGYFEGKIMAFVKLVIIGTLVLVAVVVIVQFVIFKQKASTVLLSALTIIIAAVPIALPVVMTVTQALGAVEMAKEHAIVTHLTALQEIASMSVLCSDKTGTLTTAQITIFHDKIWVNGDHYSQEDVLTFAALASNPDNLEDPIDKAVMQSFIELYDAEKAKSIRSKMWKIRCNIGFNAATKRSIAMVTHVSDGQDFIISKGLTTKVLDTGDDGGELTWSCANLDVLRRVVEDCDADFGSKGYKTIAVAAKKGSGEWEFIGIIPMLDPPRLDTASTIASIRDAGIGVKMITGDHQNIAKETADIIGLGTNIQLCKEIAIPTFHTKKLIMEADGFACALPRDKLEIVATLQETGLVVGMTGDGVNDAPALAQAQIGIAVEGATDAARATADIILTAPGLSPIYTAVVESRRIFRRIKTYILYRMASTIQLVVFLCYLIFSYEETLNPMYVILLAVLNDVATLTLAFDHAQPCKYPAIPSLTGMIITSCAFGTMLLIQAIVFYDIEDELLGSDVSNTSKGASGPREVASYFQLAMSMLMLIFSTRTNNFFLRDVPSMGLTLSVLFGICLSACVALLTKPKQQNLGSISWRSIIVIVGYNLAWFIVVDILKVVVLKFLTDDEILSVRSSTSAIKALARMATFGSQMKNEAIFEQNMPRSQTTMHEQRGAGIPVNKLRSTESLLQDERSTSSLGNEQPRIRRLGSTGNRISNRTPGGVGLAMAINTQNVIERKRSV